MDVGHYGCGPLHYGCGPLWMWAVTAAIMDVRREERYARPGQAALPASRGGRACRGLGPGAGAASRLGTGTGLCPGAIMDVGHYEWRLNVGCYMGHYLWMWAIMNVGCYMGHYGCGPLWMLVGHYEYGPL